MLWPSQQTPTYLSGSRGSSHCDQDLSATKVVVTTADPVTWGMTPPEQEVADLIYGGPTANVDTVSLTTSGSTISSSSPKQGMGAAVVVDVSWDSVVTEASGFEVAERELYVGENMYHCIIGLMVYIRFHPTMSFF